MNVTASLWRNYNHARKTFVQYVNQCVNVERGCPQGVVIGPFIWNLMIDELLVGCV